MLQEGNLLMGIPKGQLAGQQKQSKLRSYEDTGTCRVAREGKAPQKSQDTMINLAHEGVISYSPHTL